MAAPHSVIRDADTIDTPIIDSNNRPNRAIDTQSNAQPDFQPRARDDINTNPNPNPNPNPNTDNAIGGAASTSSGADVLFTHSKNAVMTLKSH